MYVPSARANDDGTTGFDATDILVQNGTYSYIAPDGQLISVSWIADENGYRAFGDHLPTPHPIPELIVQSLASNIYQEQQEPVSANLFQEPEG